MNERARAVLVDAALRGVRQGVGYWHMGGKMCAIGALHAAMPGHRASYGGCCGMPDEVIDQLQKDYDITDSEYSEIIQLNDSGVDFLGIVHKVGANVEREEAK